MPAGSGQIPATPAGVTAIVVDRGLAVGVTNDRVGCGRVRESVSKACAVPAGVVFRAGVGEGHRLDVAAEDVRHRHSLAVGVINGGTVQLHGAPAGLRGLRWPQAA